MPRLSFDALALECCFVTADLLADHYGDEESEYAFVGLASASNPLHVLNTLLLPGQRVTKSSVEQSGHDVLRTRSEIESLSTRMGLELRPISFIHRHPGKCDASTVDRTFLSGVFLDQVSTAFHWKERITAGRGQIPCDCAKMRRLWFEALLGPGAPRTLPVEYSQCFSLILNRRREFEIYAARADICPICGTRQVREVPAELFVPEAAVLSPSQLRSMRDRLVVEIAEKLVFQPAMGAP